MSLLSGTEKVQIMVNADKEFLDFFNHEAYLNSTLSKNELLEQLQKQQPAMEDNKYEEIHQEVYSEEELNFFFKAGMSNKKGSAIYVSSEEFLQNVDKIIEEKKPAEEKIKTTSDKLNEIFNLS